MTDKNNRLAEALRENLRKRKAQARARKQQPPAKPGDNTAETERDKTQEQHPNG